ncbi:hypothetical protein [Sphaerotilus sp.]|uniref:hypothetical protein n=1 Tax=Sphaerotilus sp. TaxID=2093942 RepID=UPI0034E2A9AB
MSDDHENQVFLPESFLDLHRDRHRTRLRTPIAEVRARYEACEDLAQQLVAQAQHIHFDLGVSEEEVLARIEAGLQSPDSGYAPDEAVWVARRLAELLQWD